MNYQYPGNMNNGGYYNAPGAPGFFDCKTAGDNPVVYTYKTFGKSNLFFTSVIISGVSLLITFLSGVINGGIISSIIPALVFSGLLMFYCSCASTAYSGVKTSGIKMIRITQIVAASLLGAVILMFLIVILVAFVSPEFWDEFKTGFREGLGEELAQSIFPEGFGDIAAKSVLFIMLGVLLVVGTLLTLFYVTMIRALVQVERSIRSGIYNGKISGLLTGLIITLAAFSLIGSFGIGTPFGIIGGLLSTAQYALFAVCIIKLNGRLEALALTGGARY